MSLSAWPTAAFSELFDKGEALNEGQQGRVYKVAERATQRPFVVKRPFNEQDLNDYVKAKDKQHPNLVRVFDAFMDGGMTHIVMEYCEGGDLFTASRSIQTPTQGWAAAVIRQVFLGAQYLHESFGQSHNDIKQENILLDHQPIHACDVPWVKLGDMGGICECYMPDCSAGGDPRYRAPETWPTTGPQFSARTDIWSIGVTLFELLSGGDLIWVYEPNLKGWMAFMEHGGGQLCDRFLNIAMTSPPYPVDTSHIPGTLGVDLLQKLLHTSPSKRPSASQAVQHQFFSPEFLQPSESLRATDLPQQAAPVPDDVPRPRSLVTQEVPGRALRMRAISSRRQQIQEMPRRPNSRPRREVAEVWETRLPDSPSRGHTPRRRAGSSPRRENEGCESHCPTRSFTKQWNFSEEASERPHRRRHSVDGTDRASSGTRGNRSCGQLEPKAALAPSDSPQPNLARWPSPNVDAVAGVSQALQRLALRKHTERQPEPVLDELYPQRLSRAQQSPRPLSPPVLQSVHSQRKHSRQQLACQVPASPPEETRAPAPWVPGPHGFSAPSRAASLTAVPRPEHCTLTRKPTMPDVFHEVPDTHGERIHSVPRRPLRQARDCVSPMRRAESLRPESVPRHDHSQLAAEARDVLRIQHLGSATRGRWRQPFPSPRQQTPATPSVQQQQVPVQQQQVPLPQQPPQALPQQSLHLALPVQHVQNPLPQMAQRLAGGCLNAKLSKEEVLQQQRRRVQQLQVNLNNLQRRQVTRTDGPTSEEQETVKVRDVPVQSPAAASRERTRLLRRPDSHCEDFHDSFPGFSVAVG